MKKLNFLKKWCVNENAVKEKVDKQEEVKKYKKLICLGKFAGNQYLSSTYCKNSLDWALSRRNQITR